MKSVQSLAHARLAGTAPLACLAVLGLCQGLPARAEEVLDQGVTLVSGSSSQTVALTVPSAGTLSLTLANLPLLPTAGQPDSLSALSFMISTSTQALQSSWTPVTTSLTDSLKVGPGTYFAHINGTAGGTLDLGIYSLYVTFNPSVVPLPASGWMLLTGVFVLIGLSRVVCSDRHLRARADADSAPA
jgi:hypothetical protein